MKTFTQTLMAATAMSLVLSSGAMANDNNKAYIDQNGAGNTAYIDQSGGSNGQAGAATAGFRMNQSGANNALTITQSGDAQKVGLETGNGPTGIDQTLGQNLLTVTQSGSDNEVVTAVQQGGAAEAKVNTTSVTQTHSGNEVTIIQQKYVTGAGNEAANTITISQSGVYAVLNGPQPAVSTTGENSIYRANQIGAGNTQTLSQTGFKNQIGNVIQNNTLDNAAIGLGNTVTVDQDGTGNRVRQIEQTGANNTAALDFDGTGNGTGAGFTVGGYAEFVKENYNSAVVQEGDTNTVDMMVEGNGTAFGFFQDGDFNSVGMVTFTGDSNEIGVIQQGGDYNMLELGTVNGNRNIIGLQQTGDYNKAGVDISDTDGVAEDNLVSITQTSDGFTGAFTNVASLTISGNTNDVMVDQTDDNLVTASITGDSNMLDIDQSGANTGDISVTGASNRITLSQTGANTGGKTGDTGADIDVEGSSNIFSVTQTDGNNYAKIDITGSSNGQNLSGSLMFTGDALRIGGPAVGAISQGGGSDNVADLTIAGDSNLFGLTQTGTGNMVAGEMNNDANQAAVLQNGTGNTMSFTQTAALNGGNTLGVTQ